MNIKYTIWGTVFVCVLGFGALFWSPADMNAQVETTDEQKEADHDEQGHDDAEEGHSEEVVRLSADEMREFGIELATAKAGSLDQYLDLPGEIVLNTDRMAHVVPQVSGIVREVRMTVGDTAKSGELVAVIDSRELAEAKAAFLAATEREQLALANFKREERLWKEKVTSEQEYLDSRGYLVEMGIARKSAEQQLHALGFSDTELKELPEHPDTNYTRFEIRAPFAGTIIEKHLTLGESINTDVDIFTIADLSSVWVDINVYQKDLINIRKGQKVTIEIGHGIPSASGKIAWVAPMVGETSRTAKARVVLQNLDGNLRPGLFVTARVAVGSVDAGLVVPKSALQTFEGRTVIFVQTPEGFEPKPVEVGHRNTTHVGIVSGLENGSVYVSKGSFTLKAELTKNAFGDDHGH